MRRLGKMLAWTAAALVLLVVVLGAAVMVAGNTNAGRGLIERLTERLTSGTVKLSGLGGSFPTQLTLARLQLSDRGGTWLTADRIELTWSPLRLLERRIQVDTLRAARLHFERAPLSDGHGGAVSFPPIEVGQASLPLVELGAPLVGTAASLSLQGNLRLRSLDDADTTLDIRRLDGAGEYSLHLRLDTKRLDASLSVHEPAGGPLENLLNLPGLGTLAATLKVQGPRTADAVELLLDAGNLHAKVNGKVDLTHRSADLDYSLTAATMAPRADVSWAGVALEGNWRGSLSAPAAAARLRIDRLRFAGATGISKLTADLVANAGKLEVSAVLDGLQIPGPQPLFFAKDPLKIHASLQLGLASQPLELTASHPLFALQGHAETASGHAGQRTAEVELRVPELAPYAVFTGQDVRGSVVANAQLTHAASNDALKLNGSLDLRGGAADWLGFAGPHVALQLAASLSDASLTLDGLRLGARAFTLTASGSAERTAVAANAANAAQPDSRGFLARFARQLQARWQLEVPDLAAFSGDLAGTLKMSGALAGPPTAMVGDADLTAQLSVRGSSPGTVKASVHAHGLPSTPSGTLLAHGELDGSPLTVDAALDRGAANALHMRVRQADWKSAHIEGDLTADAALTQSHGQMNVRIGQLGDLQRLLGTPLAGSAEGGIRFVPVHGKTQAQLQLDGKNLVVGPFAGSVHLDAAGVPDGLGLHMTAELPDLYGLPAELTAAADLDLGKADLKFSSASLAYHGQTLKLLVPAQLSFAKGLAVDDVRLGVQDAVLEMQGRISPVLDLDASLRRVKPGLVNAFLPGLLGDGLIEARMRLQGTLSSPTGRAQLDATDIRFADDAATGLPALSMHASAELAGDVATLNTRLDAGAASRLTASGTVPLTASGAVNLKIGGKLDAGMANPFLEARGMHATGELTADASVTGSPAAPQVGGAIALAHGSLRDYGRGVNLSDITADIVGSDGALRIKSFDAKAASGSVAMTGTFGVLQPGLPVDLKITAKNAQPIASSFLTANLDADVRVSGTARQRLDIAGTIHVNRAIIGIPDSLPTDVVVLDVRRRGSGVATAAEQQQLVIGINLAIQAPQQILVQGRGLDAEMGGEIHLTGTSDDLLASGGLDLQRGSFTISGNKLTFNEGKVSFDGAGLQKKIDPTLDFTAQTTIGNTTATLRISGFADAPRFDFSSSDNAPQDQIMALLLFGEPAAQLSALQIAQVAAALATLSGVGGGGGGNPLVRLQKTLGLDRLTVGANTVNTATGGTENSGAAIAAGRYISKRVYVEGKQTTTGTSQVQVDVDLTKHLKLQTRLGNGTATVQGTTPENDPGSSIGLSYQFEY